MLVTLVRCCCCCRCASAAVDVAVCRCVSALNTRSRRISSPVCVCVRLGRWRLRWGHNVVGWYSRTMMMHYPHNFYALFMPDSSAVSMDCAGLAHCPSDGSQEILAKCRQRQLPCSIYNIAPSHGNGVHYTNTPSSLSCSMLHAIDRAIRMKRLLRLHAAAAAAAGSWNSILHGQFIYTNSCHITTIVCAHLVADIQHFSVCLSCLKTDHRTISSSSSWENNFRIAQTDRSRVINVSGQKV